MSMVYITDKDNRIITLDAVENVTITRSGEVTSQTVQSGRELSDHYHSSLYNVSFTGLVTDSKIRDTAPTTAELTVYVNDLINSSESFTFYGRPDEGIPNLKNCFITNFEIIKDVTNFNSLQIAIALKQADIGDEAELGFFFPTSKAQGQLDSNTNTGTGTKTSDSTSEVKYSGLLKNLNKQAEDIQEEIDNASNT